MTLAELAESLDQLWADIADVKTQNEALAQMMRNRDAMNLLMTQHVQRLVREKEVLLIHMGLRALSDR